MKDKILKQILKYLYIKKRVEFNTEKEAKNSLQNK